jgi:hypothetical protein
MAIPNKELLPKQKKESMQHNCEYMVTRITCDASSYGFSKFLSSHTFLLLNPVQAKEQHSTTRE